MQISDVVLMIVFPSALTLLQLLIYPKKVPPLYLWLGFAILCSFSIGVTLYLIKPTTVALVLIVLATTAPLIVAMFRFMFVPWLIQYRNLHILPVILGVVGWGDRRINNVDTYAAIKSVSNSFNFMGFGFSKYLKAGQNNESFSNLKDSMMWKKLEEIFLASPSPNKTIKVILMNPQAYEIEKYSKVLKERYPKSDLDDDLYYSLECLREIMLAFPQLVHVRFYPNSLTYKPSFRLFFSNNNDLYVSFYRWGTTGTDLPYLHFNKSDNTFYLPFEILFGYLWEHGEIADIENMPMVITLRDVFTRNTYNITRIHKYIKRQLPQHLREVPIGKLRIAAVAIAGRDSALAILQTIKSGEYDCIVPVLVGTPGKFIDSPYQQLEPNELGDYRVRCDTIKKLKKVVEEINKSNEYPCYLLNTIFLSTETCSWEGMRRKIESHWKFNVADKDLEVALNSPCIPCHVYIYYLRAMLCQRLGINKMIGGDRSIHEQIVKVNQLDIVINAIKSITIEDFGVDFITPLLNISDNTEIERLLDGYGINTVVDVNCLFDGKGAITLNSCDLLDEPERTSIEERILRYVIPSLKRTLFELYGK